MKLIVFGTIVGLISIFIVCTVGLLGFIVGWRYSDFFIAPRDFWSKSGATMLGIKFGIALGGGYFAVVVGAYLWGKILTLFN